MHSELPVRKSPATLPPPIGYSHVAEARGRHFFISGQVARNAAGELVGPGDFVAQLEQVFSNLGQALGSIGATFSDVVKLGYFCRGDVDPRLLPEVARVRDQHVDTTRPPASTFVFVSRLVREEWLIEIEAEVALS